MQRSEIKTIIAKYNKFAEATLSESKCYQYARFIDYLAENMDNLVEGDYKSEKEIVENFNRLESEVDNSWRKMFSVGDDDESINKFIEEEIYCMITNSAKTRFDYDAFESDLLGEDEFMQTTVVKYDLADKLLWLMVLYLSGGYEPNIVAARINCDMMLAQMMIDVDSLEKLVLENLDNWKNEIKALRLATELLNSNMVPVEQVYDIVSKVLEKNK